MLSIENIKLLLSANLKLADIIMNDELRWPILSSFGIERQNYNFVEEEIMQYYDEDYLEYHHDRNHIYKVLANAIVIFQNQVKQIKYKPLLRESKDSFLNKDQVLDIINASLKRDINMLYMAVSMHDVGLNNMLKYTYLNKDGEIYKDMNSIRKHHHEVSANFVLSSQSQTLYNLGFSSDEIYTIYNAVLCHRASDNKNIPDIFVGKILCQADRCFYFTEPHEVFERAFASKLIQAKYDDHKHIDDKTFKLLFDKAVEHVKEKVGINGYAYNKIYFATSEIGEFRNNIVDILSDEEKLNEIYRKILDKFGEDE